MVLPKERTHIPQLWYSTSGGITEAPVFSLKSKRFELCIPNPRSCTGEMNPQTPGFENQWELCPGKLELQGVENSLLIHLQSNSLNPKTSAKTLDRKALGPQVKWTHLLILKLQLERQNPSGCQPGTETPARVTFAVVGYLANSGAGWQHFKMLFLTC